MNQPAHSLSGELSGVYPILYAFFDSGGRIDEAAMRKQTHACIAAGAHGIAVLGNVTEANKLELAERHRLMEIVGDEIAGRVPYAVTVGDPSTRGQQDFVKAAASAGADWVILQPPQIGGLPEKELVRFLGTVADSASLPVAVQNNPVNMPVWLSNAGLLDLHRQHPNVTLLKAEGPALNVAALLDATGGALGVFSGQGGIEYLSNLRSGCVGLVPAPDCLAQQVRIFELWREGSESSRAKAAQLHRRTLPLIVLLTRNLHAYQLPLGKRWIAKHLDLSVSDRIPSIAATERGMAELEFLADGMKPFEAASFNV